jgi:predicted metal-binding membrane protein
LRIASQLHRMRGVHWIGFYAVVIAAWCALFAMQLPADLLAAASVYGAEFWISLCSAGTAAVSGPNVFLMWVVMAAAMMAPTFLPTLATYDDLVQGGAVPGFAGYLAVWLGFSALASIVQLALADAGLLNPVGASTNRWFTAGLLALAGLYQFSAVKAACLSKCRRPMAFFMQYWALGPLRMGLLLGALCLGCCWALMALAFVGGTMNLLWMGGAMVLMTLEKLPEIGRFLTRPLGYALLAAAAVVAAT